MVIFLVCLHLSAWLIVAVTSDRFLAVWVPLKVSENSTVFRARYITLILLCVAVGYNLHIFWTIHLYHKMPGGHLSCSHYKSDIFMEKYFSIFESNHLFYTSIYNGIISEHFNHIQALAKQEVYQDKERFTIKFQPKIN